MRSGGQKSKWGFSREMRLTRKTEFQRAFLDGRRLSSHHFTIVVRKNDLCHARLGIAVSRRIACAVRRNRIRRLIRETFRTDPRWRSLHADTVVVVKRLPQRMDYKTISQELKALMGSNVE
jgi:ribonuclease P protein component